MEIVKMDRKKGHHPLEQSRRVVLAMVFEEVLERVFENI